jgi:UDP-glucuronate 4-epimerase
MTVLVAGAAGFIGFHTCAALLARGDKVIGVDELNDYYDVALKKARLNVLAENAEFAFVQLDIADRDAVGALFKDRPDINQIVNLAYAHLFRMPVTGLRFFTVYGPWGRPDMAAFIFARKILAGEPIQVFNDGDMLRDFTYIDDIVAGVIACLDRPPGDDGAAPPAAVYNIGNNRSEPLMRFIGILEDTLGAKAEFEFLPMQPGDIRETCADIEATTRDFGFRPTTTIDEGIPRFVQWYREFYGV